MYVDGGIGPNKPSIDQLSSIDDVTTSEIRPLCTSKRGSVVIDLWQARAVSY